MRILSHSHTKLKESLGSIKAEEDCTDRSKFTKETVYFSFGASTHCRSSDKCFPAKLVTFDLIVRTLMFQSERESRHFLAWSVFHA